MGDGWCVRSHDCEGMILAHFAMEWTTKRSLRPVYDEFNLQRF